MPNDDHTIILVRLVRELVAKLAWFFFLAWMTGATAGAVSFALAFRFSPALQEWMKNL